jgi:hypothetical protein
LNLRWRWIEHGNGDGNGIGITLALVSLWHWYHIWQFTVLDLCLGHQGEQLLLSAPEEKPATNCSKE